MILQHGLLLVSEESLLSRSCRYLVWWSRVGFSPNAKGFSPNVQLKSHANGKSTTSRPHHVFIKLQNVWYMFLGENIVFWAWPTSLSMNVVYGAWETGGKVVYLNSDDHHLQCIKKLLERNMEEPIVFLQVTVLQTHSRVVHYITFWLCVSGGLTQEWRGPSKRLLASQGSFRCGPLSEGLCGGFSKTLVTTSMWFANVRQTDLCRSAQNIIELYACCLVVATLLPAVPISLSILWQVFCIVLKRWFRKVPWKLPEKELSWTAAQTQYKACS